MDTSAIETARPRPLRLWPGLAIAVLLLLIRYGIPAVFPSFNLMYAFFGGLIAALLIVIWWAFFSRASLIERLGAIALIALGMAASRPILHKSIATGAMGFLYYMLALPVVALALVAAAALARNLGASARRLAIGGAIIAACASWGLLRTDGITGEGTSELRWRWSADSEQRLLAKREPTPIAPAPTPAVVPPPAAAPDTSAEMKPVTLPAPVRAPKIVAAEWPGFRGPRRDGVIRGLRIKTDWTAAPPTQIWRRQVGPGWSSFAVAGDLVYTQEQRGDFELVACYKKSTGEPVWIHRDKVRFWESNGGAGPRGTPTLGEGRVFALGATGILNALDAADGKVLWTHDVASETGAKLPGWGFSGSPLVVDHSVIVAASGHLASYDVETGARRWTANAGGGSYSSPQLVTIDGVRQVVMLSGSGATSLAAADGKVLWKYAWEGSSIIQPAMTSDGGLLISTGGSNGGGVGTRRLGLLRGPNDWKVEEKWTSNGLKPYYNDMVVHGDYAYGFDGNILSCINLQDGQRKWKGGRYGYGQMLLLADQDLLLVLSEEGEVALVNAKPAEFSEVSRFRAMDAKTWNHPAIAGNVLLVRNGEEMVAYKLQPEAN